ncbi:MAG: hypothetical protein ACOXZ4_07595 [Sphaerochaetaceae bacterium]
MMHSVADILGINFVTRSVFDSCCCRHLCHGQTGSENQSRYAGY